MKKSGIVPPNCAAVRESSNASVCVISQEALVWIPSLDALFHRGFGRSDVQAIPDGSLSGFPKAIRPSLSETLPSTIFAVSDPTKQSGRANKWTRSEFSGLTFPNLMYVGTIKGTLKEVSGANSGLDIISNDPDITMILRPHASCLDQLGVAPPKFFKVDDILGSHENVQASIHRAWVARRSWKVEVCGFLAVNIKTTGNTPGSWLQQGNYSWPFWPPNLAALDGQPVVMSGVLDADEPHTQSQGADYGAAVIDWQGRPGDDVRYVPDNPARWTEIHSPDSIRLELQSSQAEDDLIGVAVSIGTSDVTPWPIQQELTVALQPTTLQPPGTTLQVQIMTPIAAAEKEIDGLEAPQKNLGSPEKNARSIRPWPVPNTGKQQVRRRYTQGLISVSLETQELERKGAVPGDLSLR